MQAGIHTHRSTKKPKKKEGRYVTVLETKKNDVGLKAAQDGCVGAESTYLPPDPTTY